MKLFSPIVMAAIFLLSISHVCAQDIQLSYKKKIKTIKAGHHIELELPTPHQEPCTDCPPLHTMSGKLVSYSDGMLKLQVLRATGALVEDNQNLGYTLKRYTESSTQPIMTIPANVILSITKKGKNYYQKR